MNILHVTATKLKPSSGVTGVLVNLSNYQNNIEGVTARVLSLDAPVSCVKSDLFDNLGNETFKEYITRFAPDIVIIHDFYYFSYAKIAYILRGMNIPYLLEPHGAFGSNAVKKSYLKKMAANSTVFYKLIHKAKAHVFTNQHEKYDTIYKSMNSIIIPNGIERKTVIESKKKTQESCLTPSFYFLGRYDINHKGLDYLFDALDILDNEKLDINVYFYGIGSDSELKYVNQRISKLRYIKAHECGQIYGEEKKKALEDSNILLLTSRYEGSPMTILDALSYGNMCLITPGTNVADEIVDNQLGWKAELDAESIASTIRQSIKEYRVNGLNLSEHCKEYVLQHYSWDEIAKESIQMYQSVLGDTNEEE